VIVETVFNIPGVGRFAYDGIHNADLPMIQGTVQLGTFFCRDHEPRRGCRLRMSRPTGASPVSLLSLTR
jgi:hypothetical protein